VLEFRILGPLEVVGENRPLRLGGPKQRATLAILLLNANRVVSVDRLAEDLYAGAAPVTAVTQVQRQVSDLRKVLGSGSSIETRAPGYAIHLAPGQLDLDRFERLTGKGGEALARGDARQAAELFREALALWRGAPLADFAYESFAQTAIGRLEEVRLAALEQRIEADLALGRHPEVIAELEALVAEHPLREGFRAQLMLAFYRAGRQAEALDAYQRTRASLVRDFGIEPGTRLRELERAILRHDRALDLHAGSAARTDPERAVLVALSDKSRLEPLLAVGERLAALPGRELIVARMVADEGGLGAAASSLNARRASLGVPARTAAFTTLEPAREAVRLATSYDVDLVLLDAPPGLGDERVPSELAAVFERSPADVAVLAGDDPTSGEGVFVPFGGGEHDWAALELGGWLAVAFGAPLRLVGTRSDPVRSQRDASRLLADASLALQRVVGVPSEPFLTEARELTDAVSGAMLVVMGVSERWRQEGIGAARRALVASGPSPTLLVHGGPRPGGLAPRESRTRFTWSLAA
jgi:DNA-binding SARP family transcriptional activator